jgi:hypothetical protein
LGLPADALGERCTNDTLNVDGVAIAARFCIPIDAGAPSVSVSETFAASGAMIRKTTLLPIVAGAGTSRTIDDIDLSPLRVRRGLHMTLAFHAGVVILEHALALPGAIPLK